MKLLSRLKRSFIVGLLALALTFSFGGAAGYLSYRYHLIPESGTVKSTAVEADPYGEFLTEIYGKIKDNYWDKLSDDQLSGLFRLGLERLTANPQALPSKDVKGVVTLLAKAAKGLNNDQKKEMATKLAGVVINSLSPAGRNALYTKKEETNLKNLVQNINPEKDLYKDLGVGKTAKQEDIKKVYEEKSAALEKESSPAAMAELAKIKYAYDVLSKTENKQKYDTTGAEPTVFGKTLKPTVFYLKLGRVSPDSFQEFQRIVEEAKDPNLSSLILDLRGNIGGSIDLLPYFLGPFIGQNQYAYDFFHQGDYTPFKTQTGYLPGLVKFKKTVVLIDGQVQSSAEVIAAVIKRYNVGVLVGEKTKGWGTVERVFDLEKQIDPSEKYSLFLVHSLTLREDNQPVEGRGVDPTISIKDADWEKQLMDYFNVKELVEAVRQLVGN